MRMLGYSTGFRALKRIGSWYCGFLIDPHGCTLTDLVNMLGTPFVQERDNVIHDID